MVPTNTTTHSLPSQGPMLHFIWKTTPSGKGLPDTQLEPQSWNYQHHEPCRALATDTGQGEGKVGTQRDLLHAAQMSVF